MHTVEFICLVVMTVGVMLLIGAGMYCLICKIIDRHKVNHICSDTSSRYWRNINKAVEAGNRRSMVRK